MKEELDERADALLGHFVDQARRAGHSWSEIGDALGVSKQAVQQRHAIPSSDRFTQRAKNAVRNASTMAVTLGHNYVGTEHLLLGICSEPKGIGGQILSDADLALDGVRDRVLERIGRGAAPPAAEPVYTPRAKKALEATLAQALQLGHNYVGTEHLLLGLLAYGEGVGPDILAAGGVTLEHARAETIRRSPASADCEHHHAVARCEGGPMARRPQPLDLYRLAHATTCRSISLIPDAPEWSSPTGASQSSTTPR